ncbi:hypothetical protein ANTQUA_LOCUS7979 [Anthophora quadrimaculata]
MEGYLGIGYGNYRFYSLTRNNEKAEENFHVSTSHLASSSDARRRVHAYAIRIRRNERRIGRRHKARRTCDKMAHQHENTKEQRRETIGSRGAMRFNKIPHIYSGLGKGLCENESKERGVQRSGILSRMAYDINAARFRFRGPSAIHVRA